MTNQVKKDIKMLNEGELPDSFNFFIKRNDPIDWEKVKYNSLYKDFSYYENKLPKGYESIAGFDKIIQSMADHSITPSEEMDLRLEVLNKNVDKT